MATLLTMCCVYCGCVTVTSGSNGGQTTDKGGAYERLHCRKSALHVTNHCGNLNGTLQVEEQGRAVGAAPWANQPVRFFPYSVQSLDDRRQRLPGDRETLSCLQNRWKENCPEKTWQSRAKKKKKKLEQNKAKPVCVSSSRLEAVEIQR